MSRASSNDKDTLAERLVFILRKLNQGEKLCPRELADALGANIRTVQRDLNERFAFLRLEKTDGRYSLPAATLGRLSVKDVERFAALAGVNGLFPSLNDAFLEELLDTRNQAAWLVKGSVYEPLTGSQEIMFRQLEEAILGHCMVDFTYQKPDGLRTYSGLHPYKLVNHDGIWYLAAKDGNALKSFTLVKMDRLQVQTANFAPDAGLEQTLRSEDAIWLKEKKQEVVLKVTGLAASYFRRRKHVPQQRIEKELEDGGLIVSTRVAHENQILPLVRQWIPYIRIISPEGMQASLEKALQQYVQGQ